MVYLGKYINVEDKPVDVAWIVAEKLDDGVYALQSTGVSAGYWPGKTFTNSVYESNYAYKNIAFMSSVNSVYDYKFNLAYLYDQIRNAEADGGRRDDTSKYDEDIIYNDTNLRYKIGIGIYEPGAEKDGLYLISATEKSNNHSGSVLDVKGNTTILTENHYHYALYLAAKTCAQVEVSNTNINTCCAWLGSIAGKGLAWYVNSSGDVSYNYGSQNNKYVLAPAFNLDTSKVNIEYGRTDESGKNDGKIHIVPKTQPAMRIGEEYTMGAYKDKNGNIKPIKWICAEKLDDNVYAMQSEGIAGGQWPGYVFNGNSIYYDDYAYKDISSLNTSDDYDKRGNMNNFYTVENWSVVEAKGAKNEVLGEWKSDFTARNGLYLIPDISNLKGFCQYYYWKALRKALDEAVPLGATYAQAWLGSNSTFGYPFSVNTGSIEYGGNDQSYRYVLAPAFNLDITKVNVDGNVITKK